MRGKELRKAVRDYSHRTNFYKLGLIRKYIKEQYKEEQELINTIPKVVCPHCGSSKVEVGHSEREYSFDSWLCCMDCDETFDDTFGYEDAISEIELSPWSDTIAIELHFEEIDIKSVAWQEFCETEIKRYLSSRQESEEEEELDIFV